MRRIYSIDFVRGLVMVIMALDHVRDLAHETSVTHSPTDLSFSTPSLFFTRWITYLCAPVFVFLAGTSAYLSLKQGEDEGERRRFLLKRGLWLLMLEFTVVNFAVFFDAGFHTLLFEVIAATGFGFIALSLVTRAPSQILLFAGLAIICCHDLFRLIPFSEGSTVKKVLAPLLEPGAFPLSAHSVFVIGYPPLPWLGIMLVGFASGKLFELPAEIRLHRFLKLGIGSVLLFLILRFANWYGDPAPWAVQKNRIFTTLSFFNVTKYPPSLLFCLITLGLMFLIFAVAEKLKDALLDVVSTYGRVPLFYFVIHFYLIHLTMVAIMFLQGFSWGQLDFASGSFGRPKGVTSGVSLWQVYLIWLIVVLALYKPCYWFGKYKKTHRKWWLKYI